jgi:predicted site-specific integrase-resolvase
MKYLELFQNNIYSITNKIQQDNTISYTWLSQMEAKNDLLIQIEDNGISITFSGVITTPTDRAVLLKKLNSLALKENIDKNIYPIL